MSDTKNKATKSFEQALAQVVTELLGKYKLILELETNQENFHRYLDCVSKMKILAELAGMVGTTRYFENEERLAVAKIFTEFLDISEDKAKNKFLLLLDPTKADTLPEILNALSQRLIIGAFP